MSRYSSLPNFIRSALDRIEPSDGGLFYYPCAVTLVDGRNLDNVYIEPEVPYLKIWGVYPEDDRGKLGIRIEDVKHVEESPIRLPVTFANKLYRAGESGMGYTIFTVIFSDGTRQACNSGNALDFISFPADKSPKDIVDVVPHEGRNAHQVRSPGWYWCLYSE